MTAETTDLENPKRRSVLVPVAIGLILAVLLGGGSFFAVWSGLILAPPSAAGETTETAAATDSLPYDGTSVEFVPLEPITVSLGPEAGSRYLRFRGELEVDPAQKAKVQRMMPRILDMLNGFLRAVSVREIEESGALILLRAQMLRRIQIILGDDAVNDLLIVEFVLS